MPKAAATTAGSGIWGVSSFAITPLPLRLIPPALACFSNKTPVKGGAALRALGAPAKRFGMKN
jgi:hypothetical protein